MARFSVVFLLACLASPVASSGLFPAMRKRLEEKARASLQEKARASLAVKKAVVPTEPVEIPAAMDAGADGFPVLPPVNKMLGGAAVTLRTVNTRANDIAARMEVAERQSESELARQKVAFEANLKSQEEKNKAVAKENKRISDDIDKLNQQNTDIRKQAHEVQTKNAMLRSAVRDLESKMGVAKEFARKSLRETDDSKKPVLGVLRSRHRKHDEVAELSEHSQDADTSEDDSDDDDSEDDGKITNATSFLSLSSQVHHSNDAIDDFDMAALDLQASLPDLGFVQQVSGSENADALLKGLMSDISTLAQQRKEGVMKLRNLFIRDYRAGSARHAALLSQQRVLSAQRSELLNLQSKLKDALRHLDGTHTQLGRRLRNLGKFLQKLAHVANAPDTEMSRMLGNLPEMEHVTPNSAEAA